MSVIRVIYSDLSLSQLDNINTAISERIVKKIRYFCSENPMRYASALTGDFSGQYRFRIGDYRAIFSKDEEGNILLITINSVKHRREAYR